MSGTLRWKHPAAIVLVAMLAGLSTVHGGSRDAPEVVDEIGDGGMSEVDIDRAWIVGANQTVTFRVLVVGDASSGTWCDAATLEFFVRVVGPDGAAVDPDRNYISDVVAATAGSCPDWEFTHGRVYGDTSSRDEESVVGEVIGTGFSITVPRNLLSVPDGAEGAQYRFEEPYVTTTSTCPSALTGSTCLSGGNDRAPDSGPGENFAFPSPSGAGATDESSDEGGSSGVSGWVIFGIGVGAAGALLAFLLAAKKKRVRAYLVGEPTASPAADLAPEPTVAAAALGADAAGDLIAGRYGLWSRLGEGAFGTVHQAYDNLLQRTVVVKSLHPHLAAEEAFRSNTLREARIAARLQHPNLVTVYDAVEEAGTVHIVMEFVDGATLSEILDEKGKLPAAEAVRVAQAVCEGLAAVHDEGILHRDIKPSNIILDSRKKPKLMDLGIARRQSESTDLSMTTIQPGTISYMSPEQASGKHDLDERSDLYSLGVVLFRMIAGADYLDLEGKSDVERRMSIVADEPEWRRLPSRLPAAVRKILKKCLAKEPGGRYPSAEALGQALGRARAPRKPTVRAVRR